MAMLVDDDLPEFVSMVSEDEHSSGREKKTFFFSSSRDIEHPFFSTILCVDRLSLY